MSAEIDHEYTSEVVCPHCGHEHKESYEFFGNDIENSTTIECYDCEREFRAVGHVQYTYSTDACTCYPFVCDGECEKPRKS